MHLYQGTTTEFIGDATRNLIAGKLSDRNAAERQVERMLNDPRAREQSSRFIREWLNLDRLSNLRPNENRFPEWDAQLAADMRAETLAFFEEIAWEQKRPASSSSDPTMSGSAWAKASSSASSGNPTRCSRTKRMSRTGAV